MRKEVAAQALQHALLIFGCDGLAPIGQPRLRSHTDLKRFHHLPTFCTVVELSTTRLRLRPFLATDVTPAYLAFLQDPIVTRFSNQRFRKHTIASCQAYQQSFQANDNSFLLIEHRQDSAAIGTMTIYRTPQHGTADIGLMLGNRHYWQKGLGLEAWLAVLEQLLQEQGIRKVTGGTARPNIAMVRIMEESGMTLEAVRQRHELIEGVAVDLLYYARFSTQLA